MNMWQNKSSFLFLVAFLLLFVVTACQDASFGNSSIIQLNSDPEKIFGGSIYADISHSSIILKCDDVQHEYSGVNSEQDDVMQHITQAVEKELKYGNILPAAVHRISLKFLDGVPQAARWAEYCFTVDGEYKYNTPVAAEKSIDLIGDETLLEIGPSFFHTLSSSLEKEDLVRVIRLVCDYGDAKIEYIMVFDGR